MIGMAQTGCVLFVMEIRRSDRTTPFANTRYGRLGGLLSLFSVYSVNRSGRDASAAPAASVVV